MWDALGIAAMLGGDARISTRCGCGQCGERLELDVNQGNLSRDDWLIHFLVPARRFWDLVGFT